MKPKQSHCGSLIMNNIINWGDLQVERERQKVKIPLKGNGRKSNQAWELEDDG